jgi:hypothetical protein
MTTYPSILSAITAERAQERIFLLSIITETRRRCLIQGHGCAEKRSEVCIDVSRSANVKVNMSISTHEFRSHKDLGFHCHLVPRRHHVQPLSYEPYVSTACHISNLV